MADDKTANQGEGDRESARRYNERTREFVESGRADEAAEEATHMSEEERREAERAEQAGKERAKEFDPEENLDFDHPEK